jgi:hypothetical protein
MILQQLQQIVLMPEKSLSKPSDRVKLEKLKQRDKLRIFLNKRFARMFNAWASYGFNIWIEAYLDYKSRLEDRMALLIQKHFRRWLCRVGYTFPQLSPTLFLSLSSSLSLPITLPITPPITLPITLPITPPITSLTLVCFYLYLVEYPADQAYLFS